MDSRDKKFEDIYSSEIDALTQDESVYNFHADQVKSAKYLKAQHRQELINFFKQAELRQHIEKAQTLIYSELSNVISKEDFNKVKSEIDQSLEHSVQFLDALEQNGDANKDIFLQEVFGLSNDTMLQVYALAMQLTGKGRYEETLSLFVFLTALAPFISSFWIGEGLVLQTLGRNKEAFAALNCAKLLNPSDPLAYQFTLDSYLNASEKDLAKQELEQLKLVIDQLPEQEKSEWLEKLKNYSTL